MVDVAAGVAGFRQQVREARRGPAVDRAPRAGRPRGARRAATSSRSTPPERRCRAPRARRGRHRAVDRCGRGPSRSAPRSSTCDARRRRASRGRSAPARRARRPSPSRRPPGIARPRGRAAPPDGTRPPTRRAADGEQRQRERDVRHSGQRRSAGDDECRPDAERRGRPAGMPQGHQRQDGPERPDLPPHRHPGARQRRQQDRGDQYREHGEAPAVQRPAVSGSRVPGSGASIPRAAPRPHRPPRARRRRARHPAPPTARTGRRWRAGGGRANPRASPATSGRSGAGGPWRRGPRSRQRTVVRCVQARPVALTPRNRD